MINKGFQLFLGTVVLLVGVPVFGESEGPSGSIELDKGSVTLVVNEEKERNEVTVDKSEGCLAKVTVSQNKNQFVAKHDDKPCPNGSHFTVYLNPSETTRLFLKAGSVKVKGISYLLQKIYRLETSVNAGHISTSSKEVDVTRTKDFAGAKGEYKNSKISSGPLLEIQVQAGSIEL